MNTRSLKRPFVFVATSDADFDRAALDAILESGHGMRRARDLRSASQRLTSCRDSGIAVAIIDLDLEGDGCSLLRILSGCEPDFPIVVVGGSEKSCRCAELIRSTALAALTKPADPRELRWTIDDLCGVHSSSESVRGWKPGFVSVPPQVHRQVPA